MSDMQNLLPEPPATLLPGNDAAAHALAAAAPGQEAEVAAHFPASCAAWAALARRAFDAGDPVAAYAYARTGYHRGLDQLRKAGWRGSGPGPWSPGPNQGVPRSPHLLGNAAGAVGRAAAAARC